MRLREYQELAIEQIKKKWANKKTLILQLATGAGKTLVFCELIKNMKGRVLFIAHRNQLLTQASLCLAKNEIHHDVISSSKVKKIISEIHHAHLEKSYYQPGNKVIVSAIDTLIKIRNMDFKKFNLVIVDEGHHVIRENKWGIVLEKCSNARILLPTATPERLDGKGLGIHASGFAEEIVTSVDMKYLIENGFLSKYRIAAPSPDLLLSNIKLSKNGDYHSKSLSDFMQKSKIVGDIAKHYLKFAKGKLGLTFVTDLNTAERVKHDYIANNVSCEIISSKTDEINRARIIKLFKIRKIMQLISVDLLGEGVDIPAVEVVSMARPTQSYAIYAQQFGRALRPSHNKKHALIIDHVGNVFRHGLPDSPRKWSLDDRKIKRIEKNTSFITTCTNCFLVYEAHLKQCPFCKKQPIHEIQKSPEKVNGDLTLLDKTTLDALKTEITRINNAPFFPKKIIYNTAARIRLIRIHEERKKAHDELRKTISTWAKTKRKKGLTTSEIYKLFYITFGVDTLTAQTIAKKSAEDLTKTIKENLNHGY